MSKFILLGAGGHARSVADVIISSYEKPSIVFFDSNAKEKGSLYGFDIVNSFPESFKAPIIIAIGDNNIRKRIFDKSSGMKFGKVCSSKAYISERSKLGEGVFVANFCHIGPEAEISDNTIINNGAIVEHEVKIGKHCHIAPNATISGRCVLGDLVFVGVGATIINNINICSNVTIGAGATVKDHITEPGTYVGTPAKKIK
jgi:UDP-N-acetylbacillosamine N-acetyltransferase